MLFKFPAIFPIAQSLLVLTLTAKVLSRLIRMIISKYGLKKALVRIYQLLTAWLEWLQTTHVYVNFCIYKVKAEATLSFNKKRHRSNYDSDSDSDSDPKPSQTKPNQAKYSY